MIARDAASVRWMTLGVTLEVSRGLAALWVFSYHVADQFRSWSHFLSAIAEIGLLGVPAFFVISGYCMTASAEKIRARNESAKTFLYWRFMRIYPPFWCSLVVAIMVPYVVALLSALKSHVYEPPHPAWLALNTFEWGQVVTLTRGMFLGGTRGPTAPYSEVNSVYWTLAIEFQFYVVIYLALRFRRHFASILAGTSAAALIAAFFPAAYATGVFLPWWPMFLVGVILRWALARHLGPERVFGAQTSRVAPVIAASLVATFLYLTVAGVVAAFWSRSPRLCELLFAFTCAVGFWLASGWENHSRPARHRFGALGTRLVRGLLVLGSMSYSLYLIHGKIYQLPEMAVRQLVPVTSPLSVILTMAGTVALTWLFYRVCERPFLRHRV